ncbi:hypothetical protein Bca4012_017209 [Brassica carinata]|uniref:Uncharacterized protein n=1 Tax=Brassica carinata TaxID=52824 RepID=A0A8X7WLN4_BRACI|nr:hypothetical protein Bca52824_004333 [Brassica carinata]
MPPSNEALPELLDSNEFEKRSSDNYEDTNKSTTRRRKWHKQKKCITGAVNTNGVVFHRAYHCTKSLYRHVLLPNRGLAIGRFFSRSALLADAINQLKCMPFLILSGRLYPPGIEEPWEHKSMGAGFASLLGISSGSFENMFVGLAIQVFCTY